MDDWRRYQGLNHHQQELPRAPARSQNRKQPPPGFWQPTVPSWEKKFCTSVGSIPWGKLLEAKKVMSFYNNVVQWNDSAGEEAFQNAKTRFWAEINGLPCNISLPDPDIYIDEIDWNCDVDPELLLDLDREPVPPAEGEKDAKTVLLGDSLFFLNRPVPCSGWGDAEEDPIRTANNSTSGPLLGDTDFKASNGDNPWESGYVQGNNTSGNCWGNSWGFNQWENNKYDSENFESKRTGGSWGTWNMNGRKRQGGSRYMSRYNNTSRYQGDDYQADHGWKNGRGRKRVDFVYERLLVDKKPLAPLQGNLIHSCGPVSHRGSVQEGNPWSWEKPVS